MFVPPPTFEQQALLEHVHTVLARELPLSEGPYALALRPLPEGERGPWEGQAGPVLRSADEIHVSLHFDGLTRDGRPWSADDVVPLCDAAELDHARVERTVQAWARASRRVMRDAGDERFAERERLGLAQLTSALRVLRNGPRRRASTVEDLEATLLASRELRGLVAPEPEVLDAALARLDAWLEERSKLVEAPRFELYHVRSPTDAPSGPRSQQGVEARRSGLFLTVQMVNYGEDGSVCDIKEQQLFVVPSAALGDPDRVVAFLEGWVTTLPRAIGTHFPEVEVLMPHDLFDVDVLALKTPRTAEDFAAAFARRWKLAPEAG